MLSKRFQKQLVKEIARLVGKRNDARAKASAALLMVEKIDEEINTLKTQLGFDPEKEIAAHIPQNEQRETALENDDPTDLTPPEFLRRTA